jgi:hypothetical protein
MAALRATRYQVVVHVNADAPVDDPIDALAVVAAADTFDGALEVDHGAQYVSRLHVPPLRRPSR